MSETSSEILNPIPENERIDGDIAAARDSITVINEIIAKANGEPLSDSAKNAIARNVDHLEIMLAQPWIRNTNADLSDLEQAVVDGKAALV